MMPRASTSLHRVKYLQLAEIYISLEDTDTRMEEARSKGDT